MGEAESIVFIIDDDPLYRASSERLVRSVGFSVQSFESARDFLDSRRPNVPSCLVLDVRLPGLSGLDLQRELAEAGVRIPIIFVTGHGDIPMSVQAMKAGAVEFLDQTVPRSGSARCHTTSNRTRPGRAPATGAQCGLAQTLRITQRRASKKSLNGCLGHAQQANRRRTRRYGENNQIPSRSPHAKDASELPG